MPQPEYWATSEFPQLGQFVHFPESQSLSVSGDRHTAGHCFSQSVVLKASSPVAFAVLFSN